MAAFQPAMTTCTKPEFVISTEATGVPGERVCSLGW